MKFSMLGVTAFSNLSSRWNKPHLVFQTPRNYRHATLVNHILIYSKWQAYMNIIWLTHKENRQCWGLSKELEIKAPTPVCILLSLFHPHNNSWGYFTAVSFHRALDTSKCCYCMSGSGGWADKASKTTMLLCKNLQNARSKSRYKWSPKHSSDRGIHLAYHLTSNSFLSKPKQAKVIFPNDDNKSE